MFLASQLFWKELSCMAVLAEKSSKNSLGNSKDKDYTSNNHHVELKNLLYFENKKATQFHSQPPVGNS